MGGNCSRNQSPSDMVVQNQSIERSSKGLSSGKSGETRR